MAKRLMDLEVAEVSLVRKPANKRAFLIYKGEHEGGESLMSELHENILKAIKAELPGDVAAKISKQDITEEGQDVLKSLIQLLRAYKEDLPENLLETLAELAELELPARENEEEDEEEVEMEKGYPVPVKKADGSFDLSDVPKEQRAIVEALWKQSEKSELLAKELREEKDRRILKEFVEKAGQYDRLPIKAEELGGIFKALSEKANDEFVKLEGVLKAVNEALSESELFKEVGSSFVGAGDAWKKVEQMAESLVLKDANLTKEQAISKVLEMNPDLYAEYLAEQK